MRYCDNTRLCDNKCIIDDEGEVKDMLRVGMLGIPSTMAMIAAPVVDGASSTFDVVSIMSDAVTTVQAQAFAVLAIVVPAIVLITGAVVSVKFGIGWLRKVKG